MAQIHFSVQIESLPKALLQQILTSGLEVTGAAEVPAFSWRLELKRPLRRARQIQEHFQGSQAGEYSGISPTLRYDYPGSAASSSEAVSVRGLIRASPEDQQVNARVENLRFPLFEGLVFKLLYKEPGIELNQSCTVAGKVPARELHSVLKGEASRIQCSGPGKYKGFNVKVRTTVYFIEVLGLFLNANDVIESPLGPLESSTKLVDVKLGH